MSRLEEALKRASPGSPASSPGPDGMLEAYATESPGTDGSGWDELPPAVGESGAATDEEIPAQPTTTRLAMTPEVLAKVVVGGAAPPTSVEQYRRLAAVLHHAQADRGIQIVMVASALPGEGKTLTAANLALTLAESYRRRVLLVDADLRRPSVHTVFGLPNHSGLTESLRAKEDRRLTLIEVSPRLTVLTAGRPDPDPMSGLTSPRMRRVLDEARDRFDWVIVDTPPVGLLPDAHLLASMVDGALLVVNAGGTPYQATQKAVQAIGPDRVLGVVLNRMEESSFGPGTKDYGYYYGTQP